MNYQDYLKKSNNSAIAKKYAAPKGAKGKKTWGATSHKEDRLTDDEFRRNIDTLYRHKHREYAGKKSVHICVECFRPVGIRTRKKQENKFIIGKGYSGLVCSYHLKLEKELV